VLHGVAHDLGIVLELELLEHARPVGADGFHAQAELLSDLADGLAVGEQAQNLELARRKQLWAERSAGAVSRVARISASCGETNLPPARTFWIACSRRSGADSFVR
jgi:hypothetical protein